MAVRLVHPSGRRDHGRERPDCRDGAAALQEEATVSELRSAVRWDVVVIGAGHNSLVTAAYLAKAGLNTLVLERRERVGGAADT
ncbi:MAG: FAD-dependent oxidoreductase, partial [Candidatus Limnocylindrales bacterium]